MAFETKTIPVGQLMLDTKNPRHGELESQRAAIESLIASQRQKLVVLANDILKNGLSPIERFLVLKSKNGYTVLEGNRRLAAIKLLDNPALAEGTPIAAPIKRLSAKGTAPVEAECSVATSRKVAAHWLEIRHGGESEGAGVVPWSAYAANRFKSKPGREAAAAMAFLEAVAEGYPNNGLLQELAQEVGDKKITTLGRLVLDQNFRAKRLGSNTAMASFTSTIQLPTFRLSSSMSWGISLRTWGSASCGRSLSERNTWKVLRN